MSEAVSTHTQYTLVIIIYTVIILSRTHFFKHLRTRYFTLFYRQYYYLLLIKYILFPTILSGVSRKYTFVQFYTNLNSLKSIRRIVSDVVTKS